MSMRWIPIVAAAVAMAAPSSAAAESEWDYTATVYGWFAGVTTTLDTPAGEVTSEIDVEEVLEDLDIGFLGAIEARKGRVSVLGDLQYFDFTIESHPPAGAPFSDAETDLKLLFASAYATYALVDSADLRFEVGGGLRLVDVSIETDLVGQSPTPDVAFSNDESWVDGVIAARVNRKFGDRWYGSAYADVGGFGLGESSDLTWQVYGGGGYRFNETWSALGGYRHFVIERAVGADSDFEYELSGPVLGLQANF
jgi:hypothetical protein